MRLLRRFAPRNDKMVYRITYNVYRLNTVASRKLIQGLSRGRIPLEYHVRLILKESFRERR